MRKYVHIRHNKRSTNYQDDGNNDSHLMPPTRVEYTNEEQNTESFAAEVLPVRKNRNKQNGWRRAADWTVWRMATQ